MAVDGDSVQKSGGRFPLRFNLRLAHKAMLLVAVPLASEIAIVLMLSQLLQRAESAALEENYSKEVISLAESMMKDFSDVERTFALYLMPKNTTLQELPKEDRNRITLALQQLPAEDRSRVDQVLQQLPEKLGSLDDLVRDHAQEAESMKTIQPLASDELALLEEARDKFDQGGRSLAFDDDQEFKDEMAEFSRQLTNQVHTLITAAKTGGAVNLKAKTAASNLLQVALKAAVAFNVFLAVFLALFVTRGTVRRLELLVDNSKKLAGNQPLNPPMEGQDEIAHLDRVFHDMAAALAEADRRKQELDKLKQEFVAMVSHDLRTPLTSVQGSLDLLERGLCGKLPEEADQRVSVARRNLKRSITLINDLLDLEKLEAGKMELAIIRLRLSDVIEQSVESVATLAEKREIKIEANPCLFEIFADRERLIRVLVNLLSNAVKFSPDQGLITVSTMRDDEFTTVKVSDQGRGVPATHREAIFERYRQVSISDEKEKGGTGLGLPICKEIIHLHGGAIGVESEEGKGSTFWFTVPSAQFDSKGW